MTDRLIVKGTALRYLLTHHLCKCSPQTVDQLVEALDYQGFTTPGRPSKWVSDALRWEIAHDRVRRVRRGTYAARGMPRSTEYRITKRVQALRDQAAEYSSTPTDSPPEE